MKRNSMEKVSKVINKEFDEMDAVVFATERGILLNGSGTDLATILCTIIHQLYKSGMPKEMLENCFEVSLKEPKEVLKELKEQLEGIVEGEKKDESSDTNG